MATADKFQLFFSDIERRVLSIFAGKSFWSTAGTSLGRGILGEIVESINESLSQSIVWIAFISAPYLPDSWLVTASIDSDERTQPLQVVVPEPIASRVQSLVTRHNAQSSASSIGSFFEFDVPMVERKKWDLASEVHSLYAQLLQINLEEDGELSLLEGVLVVASNVDLGPNLPMLGDVIEHSTACVLDRLRLAQAADSAPMRVLASLDDTYQRDLIRARRASGLREFLDDLEAGILTPTGAGEATIISPHTPTNVPKRPEVSVSRCRDAFRSALDQLRPEGPKTVSQLRLAPTSNDTLQTPAGKWFGWAEYKYGLAELRLRSVALDIAFNSFDINRCLARFLSETRTRRREASLAVLAPAYTFDELSPIINEWKQVIDIAYSVLPE